MKVISSIMLTFLLGSMFVGLFHLTTSMDMTGGTAGCPSMAHHETICPMGLADHLSSWKSTFIAITPALTLLLALAGAVALTVSLTPHLFAPKHRPRPLLYRQLRERTYRFSHRPLQELFSDGILHPKLF